ncbi:MAG TPA: efflux RND transporter periplasmic adaptor subunit [Vicinamibacterales bacterium]|nr:efflux RND transporter periplasmic adaptor subunit [Vicinamibacterales bacterium]
MTRRAWLVPLLAVTLAGCGRSAPPPPENELPTVAVTRWTAGSELFAEHPVLVVGQPARFAIHLTDLATFKPLTRGVVRVHLSGTQSETFSTDAPSRPGIFGVTVTPKAAGAYTLRIDVAGPLQDAFDLGAVDVFGSLDAARAFKVEEPTEERIAFLKEQQWSLEFGTAVADRRKLRPSVLVPGEIRPRTGGETVVSAPVSGRLVSASTGSIGTAVRAGDVLAQLLPRSGQSADRPSLELTLSETQAQLELARAERSRAERLTAAGAVPARRLSEALVAEKTAQAAVDTATKLLAQLDVTRTGQGQTGAESRFVVRAPTSGVIAETNVTPGMAVEQGQALFRIVAVDVVHVVAQLPEADLSRAATITDGELMVPGQEMPMALGRPISRGRVLEPASRTLPVVFSLAKPAARLVVGQRVSVRLFTATGSEAVAVPVTALVDDAGRPVVFVQREGESFARRPVTVGARDGAYIAIEGITAGDRVVVRGAPLVRLAALSTQVPSHGHVH